MQHSPASSENGKLEKVTTLRVKKQGGNMTALFESYSAREY